MVEVQGQLVFRGRLRCHRTYRRVFRDKLRPGISVGARIGGNLIGELWQYTFRTILYWWVSDYHEKPLNQR